MRYVMVFLITLLFSLPAGADPYSECDVDVGCSDEVADYQDVAVPAIDLSEFRKLYESGQDYVLIDVRPKYSYDSRHIQGARSLFVAQAKPEEIKAVLPDKQQKIIVYCSNPRCPMSQHAGQLLRFLGYRNVANYKGGLEEWYQYGLPVSFTPLPPQVTADVHE
ncbi:MAG: rhodanese-like domain-containing protein [Candidatus Omnitrophica bacterium]|nr:rhodanese-like domain-containing protein [Candidatus Omnitrophota bacterium]